MIICANCEQVPIVTFTIMSGLRKWVGRIGWGYRGGWGQFDLCYQAKEKFLSSTATIYATIRGTNAVMTINPLFMGKPLNGCFRKQ